MSQRTGHVVELEEWEYAPIAKLFATFAVNTPNDGMTPNPYASFRRYREPILLIKGWEKRAEMAAKYGPDHEATAIMRCKEQLNKAWECTLVTIDEAQLYDGSDTGAVAFEVATGLTPSKFARAWLEAEGGIWRGFHPAVPGGGPLVIDALCGYWALRVQNCRKIGIIAAKAKVEYRYGTDFLENIKEFVDHRMKQVMCLDGEKKQAIMLIRALEAKGHFDCTAHPTRTFCSCETALDVPLICDITTKTNFVRAWEASLMNDDDAFIFTGDAASATAFERSSGKSPKDHAKSFLAHDQGIAAFFKPSISQDHLTAAMLAFWAHKMRNFRECCKTRREARTKWHELSREAGGLSRISLVTGLAEADDVHKNDSDDPLLRFVQGGQPGHKYTIVLYAKHERDAEGRDAGGYNLIRVAPCHDGCPIQVSLADVHRLTAAFVDEDMEKAKQVVPEW